MDERSSELPVRVFGTNCRLTCEDLTSAANILLRHYFVTFLCLTMPRPFVTYGMSASYRVRKSRMYTIRKHFRSRILVEVGGAALAWIRLRNSADL